MQQIKVIFFGSFQSYSVQVLDKLVNNFTVTTVVTTPPRPAGRHQELTPTAVETFCRKNQIPVYPLETLESIPPDLDKPDFLIVAGYGKLIPTHWLKLPMIMPINIHQSLLPKYRGRCPGEWAILQGEKETGITLIQMSPEFDQGGILAQQTIPITETDTRETLYRKLYDLGGDLIVKMLPKIAAGEIKATPQPNGEFFYARQITREDGFMPYEELTKILVTDPEQLDRKFRALAGWPGLWSTTPDNKRLKIISLKPKIMIQLEGKKPINWRQFSP